MHKKIQKNTSVTRSRLSFRVLRSARERKKQTNLKTHCYWEPCWAGPLATLDTSGCFRSTNLELRKKKSGKEKRKRSKDEKTDWWLFSSYIFCVLPPPISRLGANDVKPGWTWLRLRGSRAPGTAGISRSRGACACLFGSPLFHLASFVRFPVFSLFVRGLMLALYMVCLFVCCFCL